MGCPAPKVVKAGDGSALMKDPKLAFEIVNKSFLLSFLSQLNLERAGTNKALMR